MLAVRYKSICGHIGAPRQGRYVVARAAANALFPMLVTLLPNGDARQASAV